MASLEEVFGADFNKTKRKSKKIVDRRQEDKLSNKYSKMYKETRSKTDNKYHLMSEDELSSMPKKTRQVLGYDMLEDDNSYAHAMMDDNLKKSYDYEEEIPDDESDINEDMELNSYLDRRQKKHIDFAPRKRDTKKHVQKEYFQETKSMFEDKSFNDIALYGISGIALIFMMENIIKIGQMMGS